MLFATGSLGLATLLAVLPSPQEATAVESPFLPSTALEQGLSPEALASLGTLVQDLVDADEIVGAELMVIKNGRTVLHEAYGWADRAAEVPMETGSVFCVRSMTKPVVGAAIRLLIEEGLLRLSDRVSEHLPSFDAPSTREITVEELLTHTSGLPMSLILGKDLKELQAAGGIRAVADLGGGHALEFSPGEGFNYSDQGTDTLTALIEVASGMSAAEFVRTRVLDPLGMQASACVLTQDSPLRERALPLYVGSRGAWTRIWGPDEPTMFPFFLGSQGLYSTLEDYARFLEMWRRKGRIEEGRLLRASSVRKTLRPGPHPMQGSTGLPGTHTAYGSLMQLWLDGEDEVVAFGHTGSDGTHAWVFPEQNAMALYFTQSRGNLTGLRVEEVLGELLLGVPFDTNQLAPPFEEYLGYYWEGEGDLYRAIVRDGDDLALEIMGKASVPLAYVGDDRWKLRPSPGTVLAFDRSETGEVTGYHIGEHQEFRFEPAADLPGAAAIAARVRATHGMDLLESLGPMRVDSQLEIAKLELSGKTESWYAWPDRFRSDNVVGEEFEHVAFDGSEVRYASRQQDLAVLEGPRAEDARLDSLFARLGDWQRWHPRLETIQTLERGGRTVVLVRTGDCSAPARTFYVDLASGRLLAQDSIATIDGMGRVGRHTEFQDYRDVSGVLLPHRIEVDLANPLIGSVVITTTAVEFGAALPEGAFELSQ